MRRTADVPTVLGYLTLALLALALVLSVRTCRAPVAGLEPPRMTPIHIKYRPGMASARAIAGATAMRPLFRAHRSAAAYDDPRERWFRIEVDARHAQEVLAQLARDPAVEQAFVPPIVTLPTVIPALDDPSCPITTPSFESYQGYLGPAPHGIDAPAAWRRGVRGQGVWFADIEGGWNARHEDLPGDRIAHVSGRPIDDPHWRAHGTAVLGEVVGVDNGKGVVGIAPDVERVFTSSIGGVSVAEAIDNAAEQLRPGDVLLIELQGTGPRGRFLPMEYWDDNYDAIEAATRRGVVVIEAAGNGGENLDHRIYRGKLERKTRDSGAIMVGAGGPPREGFEDRARLDFSNYGSRVDVQGWGRKVATVDYGDLQSCAAPEMARAGFTPARGNGARYTDRHYTGEFAGTSSASPIVAGAAVLLESYAKQHGRVLAPEEVRDILAQTGTPQTSDPAQHIGPRPDLSRALLRVQRYAGEWTPRSVNPAEQRGRALAPRGIGMRAGSLVE
jgi:subtilisin family serine protease